jgi:hypothetical protein
MTLACRGAIGRSQVGAMLVNHSWPSSERNWRRFIFKRLKIPRAMLDTVGTRLAMRSHSEGSNSRRSAIIVSSIC